MGNREPFKKAGLLRAGGEPPFQKRRRLEVLKRRLSEIAFETEQASVCDPDAGAQDLRESET
jgi:hypothetical protein